jgi:type IV pilus biogenesis protein CpaD/CtpE
MKKAIDTLLAIALAACTAENIPEKPTTPEPTTEKVSINIRLAEPATKALINDSGSGAASFSWENGDQIGVVVGVSSNFVSADFRK